MRIFAYLCGTCQMIGFVPSLSVPDASRARCGRCGQPVGLRAIGEAELGVQVTSRRVPMHTVIIRNSTATGGKAGVKTGAGVTTFIENSDFRGMPVAIDNTDGGTIHARGNRHRPDYGDPSLF